ncbi:hypothetical protein [Paenibacillus sp. Pae108]|uniref:hypothetical protein n=1 Tax=Paenibacillus sp. Pae108 TaxID=2926019 RepID=UPI0021189CB3|nr:hypothetical protein [Paenibacillus sp. Pae108]
MKIKIVKGFRPVAHKDFLKEGAILEARKLFKTNTHWDYQCIDGEYSGIEIPWINCVELPKESLYTESEYQKMKNEYEKKLLVMEDSQKQRDIEFTIRIEELEKERYILLQQIERSIEGQSKEIPVIPLEVAEAIIWFRKSPYSNSDFAKWFWRDIEYDDNKHTRALKHYIKAGNGDKLLQALVNGYTIEQVLDEPSHDEKLKACIEDAIKDWQAPHNFKLGISTVIANRVKEFFAEQNT